MTRFAVPPSRLRPPARPKTPPLLLAGLVAMVAGVLVGHAEAQPDARQRRQEALEATALSVARAFDERLTIWQGPDGSRTYAGHCRSAPGGCVRRPSGSRATRQRVRPPSPRSRWWRCW